MTSPGPRDSEVVETELDRSVYERLRHVADQEGVSVEQAARTAIREYVQRHLRFDRDDPLFGVTPGTGDRETDARATDESLAGVIDADDRE